MQSTQITNVLLCSVVAHEAARLSVGCSRRTQGDALQMLAIVTIVFKLSYSGVLLNKAPESPDLLHVTRVFQMCVVGNICIRGGPWPKYLIVFYDDRV